MAPSPWLLLVEPSTAAIVATAVGVVHLAGVLSDTSRGNTPRTLLMQQTSSISSGYAMVLPLFASAALILLFYFFADLYLFLVIYMASVCSGCLMILVQPLAFRYLVGQDHRKAWAVAAVVAAAVAIAWGLTFFWVLTDVLAVSLAIVGLFVLRLDGMRVATILLVLFFIYDLFWVFYSEKVFNDNVMVSVATRETLPNVVTFPRVWSRGYSLLGLGDIFLPGLLITFVFRFDRGRALYKGTLAMYAVGLVATFVAVVAMDRAQPALVWIVPCTLGFVAVQGWRTGRLADLWRGGVQGREEGVLEGGDGEEEAGLVEGEAVQ